MTAMAMPMQFDARALRDAQKWDRWSLKRRLAKMLLDPAGARRMSDAHAAVTTLAMPVQQQKQYPAFWNASKYMGLR